MMEKSPLDHRLFACRGIGRFFPWAPAAAQIGGGGGHDEDQPLNGHPELPPTRRTRPRGMAMDRGSGTAPADNLAKRAPSRKGKYRRAKRAKWLGP